MTVAMPWLASASPLLTNMAGESTFNARRCQRRQAGDSLVGVTGEDWLVSGAKWSPSAPPQFAATPRSFGEPCELLRLERSLELGAPGKCELVIGLKQAKALI